MVEFNRNIAQEASRLPDHIFDPSQSVVHRANALKTAPTGGKKRRIPWFMILTTISALSFYMSGGLETVKDAAMTQAVSQVMPGATAEDLAMIKEAAAQQGAAAGTAGQTAKVSIQMNGKTVTQEVSIPQMEVLQKLQKSGAF